MPWHAHLAKLVKTASGCCLKGQPAGLCHSHRSCLLDMSSIIMLLVMYLFLERIFSNGLQSSKHATLHPSNHTRLCSSHSDKLTVSHFFSVVIVNAGVIDI